jgi:hypothetical protein
MAEVTFSPNDLANKVKVIAGQHTTVAASDNVTIEQLTTIVSAVVSLDSDPGDDPLLTSATFSTNVLTIKTWKTNGSDPTPGAASTFTKKVNYIVVGY